MRRAGEFKHTAETDARIRAGYAVNERVSSIAKALGVTRNVVIGRAFRMGLSDPRRIASPENRARLSERAKDWHAANPKHGDPKRHAKIIAALHAGRARYHAERRAKAGAA